MNNDRVHPNGRGSVRRFVSIYGEGQIEVPGTFEAPILAISRFSPVKRNEVNANGMAVQLIRLREMTAFSESAIDCNCRHRCCGRVQFDTLKLGQTSKGHVQLLKDKYYKTEIRFLGCTFWLQSL